MIYIVVFYYSFFMFYNILVFSFTYKVFMIYWYNEINISFATCYKRSFRALIIGQNKFIPFCHVLWEIYLGSITLRLILVLLINSVLFDFNFLPLSSNILTKLTISYFLSCSLVSNLYPKHPFNSKLLLTNNI